jgi:hypothetical protein
MDARIIAVERRQAKSRLSQGQGKRVSKRGRLSQGIHGVTLEPARHSQ